MSLLGAVVGAVASAATAISKNTGNVIPGKVTVSSSGSGGSSSSGGSSGSGYAYVDKYGFSHVVADKATADKYAAAGSSVYSYSGSYSGGYARTSSGDRIALQLPGAVDFGNKDTDVSVLNSGSYSQFVGSLSNTQIRTLSGADGVVVSQDGSKTTYSPLSLESYINQYKNTYGYYPWQGNQTLDGSVPSYSGVYGSTLKPFENAKNLSGLFSLPSDPSQLQVNPNLSEYLVFGGLVLLVIKLFKR